jgi:transposase
MAGVVLAGPQRHRRFSEAEKITIIGESFMPGVRVRDVMERYGLASSVIYTWRKEARQGKFSGGKTGMFAPVAIVEPKRLKGFPIDASVTKPPCELSHSSIAQPVDSAAMIVALPDGVRIMVNNGVEEDALGKVLRALSHVARQ